MASLKNLASSLFLGKVLAFLIRFFLPVILVRLISKSEFGIFQQFLLLTNTFILFLNSGIKSSLLFFYPRKEEAEKSRLISQTLFMHLLTGVVFIALYVLGEDQLYQIFGINGFPKVGIYVPFYIVFIVVSNMIDQLLVLQEKPKFLLIFPPIDKIFRTVIILVTVVAYVKNSTGVILGLFLFSCVRFLIVSIYILRSFPITLKTISSKEVKAQIQYALPLTAAVILGIVGQKIDKIVINHYISPEEFAVYAVSFLSIPMLGELIKSVNMVIIPKISEFLSKDQFNKAKELWRKAVIKNASVAIPCIFFVFVMCKEIIVLLYTAEYSDAANYMRILIMTFLFTMTSYAIIINGKGKTRYILIIDIICTIITIGLAIYLIKIYNIYGAAVTALISVALPTVIKLHYDMKFLNTDLIKGFPWKDIGKIMFFSIPFSIIVYLIKTYITSNLLSLLICGVVYFIPVIIIQYKKGYFIYPEIIRAVTKGITHFLKQVKK